MAAKILLSRKSSRERLKRLSVVYAVGLRLKIVAELYKRDMSATQFFNEFGGGSPSRVAKNFRRLAEEGWLRYVRSAPSASGRGKEDFYRATELAFFEQETWMLMPYSLRVASSWSLLSQLVPQLGEAIEVAGERERKDLVCTSLLLDEVGWRHAIKAVEAQFVALFEHQEDARLRAVHSGEELIRADVYLLAFEVPTSRDRRAGPALVELRKQPVTPFPERIAPILADEPSLQIVAELNKREMTGRQFHREFHREFNEISPRAVLRRFTKLRETCWVDIVGEEAHRGKPESVYRATVPATYGTFGRPDQSTAKEGGQWEQFDRFCAEAELAMRTGTYDARLDRFDTWSMLSLDRYGWECVIEELDALFVHVCTEQEQAKKRMRMTGEEPIAMNLTIGAYESPEEPVKAP